MQFNTEVLSRPLTPQETEAIRARARQGRYGPAPFTAVVGLIVGIVMIPPLVLALLAGAAVLASAYPSSGWLGGLLVVGVLVAAVAAVFGLIKWFRNSDRAWLPLAAFADANGLSYRRMSRNPYYPGLLFGVARSSAVLEHVFSNSGTFADAGSYSYQVGSEENRRTVVWYYAAFRLPRLMPHIVLDATANNSGLGSNLPIAFGGSQVVKLGDPFDQHYRLYAPGDYQLDAFYMFPPDLMEMLMRTPVVMDIEIIDSWMFIYTKQRLDLTQPGTWQMLGYIDDTIVGRMNRIDVRYNDSRVAWYEQAAAAAQAGQPPPAIGPGQHVRRPWIAPPGQRLRRSNRGVWIALAVVALMLVIPLVSVMIAGLMVGR